MIKGYELYELIAKGNTLQNTKIIDARNKVWKFDGAEFVKETGDSDVYSDLEFATMDFKIIEDEEEIDIQSIEHEDVEIVQEILGKCDLWKGNEEYILKVIKENNNRIVDAVLKLAKENRTIIKAVKQLDKKVNSIEQK